MVGVETVAESDDNNGDSGNNELGLWLGVGVAAGAGVGTVLSVALGNLAFGAVAVCPELIFGAAIGAARSPEEHEDMEVSGGGGDE